MSDWGIPGLQEAANDPMIRKMSEYVDQIMKEMVEQQLERDRIRIEATVRLIEDGEDLPFWAEHVAEVITLPYT